jgi:hypothetical protein
VLVLAEAGETAAAIGVRLGVGALLALVAALVLAWTPLIPVSLVLLGAAYAVPLAVDDTALDGRAPLVGVGLVIVAELSHWSLEERERVRGEPGDGFRRLGFVSLLGLAALLVGASLLAVVDVVRTGGLAVDLVGAVAAAAALVVIVWMARARPTP